MTTAKIGIRIQRLNAMVDEQLSALVPLATLREAQNWIIAAETSLGRAEHPSRRATAADVARHISDAISACDRAQRILSA